MSHFYAEIQGSRGMASRCGTKTSGHWCHIRGWDSGVEVYAIHHAGTRSDRFEVYATGGSNSTSRKVLLGTLTHCDDGSTRWDASDSLRTAEYE